MKKVYSLLLSLLCVGAFAQLQSQTSGSGFIPGVRGTLLYDQANNASGNGAPCQDFEASFDAYDATGADDFVVDYIFGWDIDSVGIVGTYSVAGPVNTVNVAFYADNAGFPAASPIVSFTGLTPIDSAGAFTINLPSTVHLDQGTYWVSFQAQMDFGVAGQHFWSNRTVTSNSGAVWRNPGNGFGTGCTAWQRMSICGVGGGFPDFQFQLGGTEASAPIPTMGQYGMIAFLVLLAASGVFFLRRRRQVNA